MAPAEPDHEQFKIQGEEPYFAEELEGWKGYIEWEKVL
jgi:sulfite oxidase